MMMIVTKPNDNRNGDAVSGRLRPETGKFLHTLKMYLDCRAKMDAKYLEVDEFQLIKAQMVEDDSKGIQIQNNSHHDLYKPKYQQQSTSGVAVEKLDDLYDAAEIAAQVLHQKLDSLVAAVSKECGNKDDIGISIPPFKSRERASQKADDDYSKREPGPGIAWLYDILRCSILLSSAEQVLKCIELIQIDDEFHIVKARNRFQNPALTGYRDLNFHVQIDTHQGFKHICEIQIHHRAIQSLDAELCTHSYYEYFRTYFAGDAGSLVERLDDLRSIADGVALNESFLDDLLQSCQDVSRLQRLGKLFDNQLCEHAWALKVWEKVLQIQEDDSSTGAFPIAETYSSLAHSLRNQGNMEGALEFFKKSLSFRIQEYDPKTSYRESEYMRLHLLMYQGDKPSLAELYNNIGLVLFEQQTDLRGAVINFQTALRIQREHFKTSRHPEIAKTYANLAMVLRWNDQLDRAMELYEILLETYEHFYGTTHLSVAETYNHMALIMYDKERYDEAIELHKKSFDLIRKKVGHEHYLVADIHHHIGNNLRGKKKLDQALDSYRTSLELKTKILGEQHTSVAKTQFEMGTALADQNRLGDAMELYEKSLESYKRSYGESHSRIADTYKRMAAVLRLQGQNERASILDKKSLDIIMTLFGS